MRVVRQTPTYDQLRGERINADVPPSEVDPDWLDRPGRHRLREDALAAAAVCGPPPRSRGEGAEEWCGVGTGIDHPGKHRLRDHAPAATTVRDPTRGPATDRAEGWSWFGTKEPGSAELAKARPAVPCVTGTHCRCHTSAVDQRPGSDHRAGGEQTPQALVPPPAHARDNQQPRALGAGRDARAVPGEPLAASQPAKPDHANQSLDPPPGWL